MANGNTIDFIRLDGVTTVGIIATDRSGGQITNCEVENQVSNLAVSLTSANGSWTISANNISNNGSSGINVTSGFGDNFVGIFNSNTILGNQGGAIGLTAGNQSQMRVRVTNNTMTGNLTLGRTFNVLSGANASFCADITGNINDDVYLFFRNSSTSILQIEQFAQLTTINSGGAVVNVDALSQPIQDVIDGFCGF